MVPGMFGAFAPRYFIGRPLLAFAYPLRSWGTYGLPLNSLAGLPYAAPVPTWRYPPYYGPAAYGPAAYGPLAPPFAWSYAYPPAVFPYGAPYVPFAGFYPYRITYAYPSAVVMPVRVVPPVLPPWYNPAVTPVVDWPGQVAQGSQPVPVQQAGARSAEGAAAPVQVAKEVS